MIHIPLLVPPASISMSLHIWTMSNQKSTLYPLTIEFHNLSLEAWFEFTNISETVINATIYMSTCTLYRTCLPNINQPIASSVLESRPNGNTFIQQHSFRYLVFAVCYFYSIRGYIRIWMSNQTNQNLVLHFENGKKILRKRFHDNVPKVSLMEL